VHPRLFCAGNCGCGRYSDGHVAKLVFDIETTAQPLEHFDAVQQEYLFREAENLADPAARASRRGEIHRQFSLWPFTGQVVCIAMANADTCRGKALFVADDFDGERPLGNKIEFVPCADEAELLVEFWELAGHYDSIITFNGRGFDVPFIYLRSAILNVPISRKDWLGYRYQVEPHCDLIEQLTFYGVSGREGAGRRFNLDFYCKAFGIESPKSHGVTGMDITRMMDEGRAYEIARYCMHDVLATVTLYRLWKERLSSIK
jgi:DNA polymerase elongation subunit (family B)